MKLALGCDHGGFGLMANGGIPKPTLWTFAFFAGLAGEPVYRDENAVIVRRPDGGYEAVLWNLGEETEVSLSFPIRDAVALIERVDAENCDPLTAWHRMGQPESLTAEQLCFLRGAGQPGMQTAEAKDGRTVLKLGRNAVLRLRVLKAPARGDAGYDYDYYCKD